MVQTRAGAVWGVGVAMVTHHPAAWVEACLGGPGVGAEGLQKGRGKMRWSMGTTGQKQPLDNGGHSPYLHLQPWSAPVSAFSLALCWEPRDHSDLPKVTQRG